MDSRNKSYCNEVVAFLQHLFQSGLTPKQYFLPLLLALAFESTARAVFTLEQEPT